MSGVVIFQASNRLKICESDITMIEMDELY
jgi:hypothetical protein